jgi:hypothetical protein
VWSTKATSSGVKVHASVASFPYIGAAKFSVCPDPKASTCDVGVLATDQLDELQATVKVGSFATLGELVEISAKATGADALSFTGSARDKVVEPSAKIPGSTVSIPPEQNLPSIPGTGVSAADPSGLFPTVSASPTPSLGSPSVRPAKRRTALHAAADTSATVPVDDRLIGGQLAGLAVLAGAVAMAIARLSLRAPKPQEDANSKRPSASGPQPQA